MRKLAPWLTGAALASSLQNLLKYSQDPNHSEAEARKSVQQYVDRLATTFAVDALDVLRDQYASHVLRRFISLLSGYDATVI